MSRFSAPPSRAVPHDRRLRHTVCHTFITRQALLQGIKSFLATKFLEKPAILVGNGILNLVRLPIYGATALVIETF